MKKTFSILSKIFSGIAIFVLALLVGEWIYSEIQFQIWLNEDDRRFDFSDYYTAEELRGALLIKLPLNSSEDDIQAFRMAHGYTPTAPDQLRNGGFGLVMQEAQQGHGLLGVRFVIPWWTIYFHVDPIDHRLIDIRIETFIRSL